MLLLAFGGGVSRAGTLSVDASLPPIARVQAERALMAPAVPVVPPVPRFEPAPRPNEDFVAPRGPVAAPGPVIGAGLIRQTQGYRGDGFVQGSAPSQSQQPRRMPLPGITLKVPLN